MDNELEVQGAMDTVSQVIDTLITPVKDTLMKETSEAVPNWLSNSITKKRSLVPTSIPIKDVVSKYSVKTPGARKPRMLPGSSLT